MLPSRLQETLDDLAMLTDRQERIDYLISLAEEFQNAADVPRTPQTRVPGCESEVYMTAAPSGDGVEYRIAVDNPQGISAMAMARVLEQSLNGQPPSVVAQVPEDIVYRIFGNELSMGKSMGLTGMVGMAKALAVAG